jgi:hypothetical protein
MARAIGHRMPSMIYLTSLLLCDASDYVEWRLAGTRLAC